MLPTALNHVTVARKSDAQCVGPASGPGCVGITMRDDLAPPLCDGMTAAAELGALAA